MFIIFAENFVSHDHLTNQKIATIVTQILDKESRNTTSSILDFLTDTLEANIYYKKLIRYMEHKDKGPYATKGEKELMKDIARIDNIIPFLPED